jgi:hypothetical protein
MTIDVKHDDNHPPNTSIYLDSDINATSEKLKNIPVVIHVAYVIINGSIILTTLNNGAAEYPNNPAKHVLEPNLI